VNTGDWRARRLARVACAAASAALLGAAPAVAAEDGLTIVPELGLLVLLMVLFALLVLPTDRLLFRPLFRLLDEREARTLGTRRRAEKLASEAEAVLERYESAVHAAREEAERERRARLDEAREGRARRTAEAREEAEQRVETARRDVQEEFGRARDALRAQAEGLAREATERVLGRTLS